MPAQSGGFRRGELLGAPARYYRDDQIILVPEVCLRLNRHHDYPCKFGLALAGELRLIGEGRANDP
jgi:hypothetical protein